MKEARTYYGYEFACHDANATHSHGLYGECWIPSTVPPWTEEGIASAAANDDASYERAECRTCHARIVKSGPRGGWAHVNPQPAATSGPMAHKPHPRKERQRGAH